MEMLQALWRPLTGLVMAVVVLLVALGWLPPAAAEHADSVLAAAGAVLVGLTGMRGAQRIAEVRAEAEAKQAGAKLEEFIPGELRGAPPDPALAEAIADRIVARLADRARP